MNETEFPVVEGQDWSGKTVSDGGEGTADAFLGNDGHRTWFVVVMGWFISYGAWLISQLGGLLYATSATSRDLATIIGAGLTTLDVGTGKAFGEGQYYTAHKFCDTTKLIHGLVTAYDTGTGILSVSIGYGTGTGTVASWVVRGSGPRGPQGEAGIVNVGSATPLAGGTAAAGASANASREDHVHPFSWATQTEHDTGAEAAKASAPLTVAGSPYTIGKNVFINGAMEIWQAGTGSTTATSGSRNYLADQWYVNPSGANMAMARSTTVPAASNKARYSLQVTGATSGTTCLIGTRVPAADVPMVKGYATFSAYVDNATGGAFTPNLLIGTPGAADDFTTVTNRLTQALQSCPDGAVTRVTYTVDISGYTNLANGLQAELQIPSGSLDSGAKAVRVTMCQFELGRVATAFERLPVALILFQCQYFYRVFATASGNIGHGFADGATSGTIAFDLGPPMRVEPTFSVSAVTHFQVDAVSGGSGATTGLTAAGAWTKSVDLRPVRSGSTWTAGQGIRLLAANASAALIFNARL